jgi:hypothetical protein
MKTDFNEAVMFYKKNLQSKTDKNNWVEQFDNKVAFATQVHDKLSNHLALFFEIIFGFRKEEFPQMSSMFFSQRFIKENDNSKNSLSNKEVERIIKDFFFLGYFYHIIYTDSNTRENVDNIESNVLFEKWLPNTVKANVIMREHIKEENKMPETQFKLFYSEKGYEQFFEKKNISFHKIAKIYSYLKNIYYCGMMLGLYCDTETNA